MVDGPALEQPPQANPFARAAELAQAKGAERRQAGKEKVSRFFSSIKEKVNNGINFALGSPDAAVFLGKQAVQFTQEKAEQVKNSVVEAGTRAWENTVDAKDRMVWRVQDAGDRVRGRIKDAGNAARRKTVELSKKAAVWGLANVAVPLENTAQAICEIPAELTQWRADSAAERAEGLNARAALKLAKGEARVAALRAQMESVQRATEDRFSNMGRIQEAARTKATELSDRAAEKRGRVRSFFGRARLAVETLRTS